MATESSRASNRTHGSVGADRSPFWSRTLEQADSQLQLALCFDGGDCWNFLRQGVGRSTARQSVGHYTCHCRHLMVALAAVKMARRKIVEIAEADAHIVQHGCRNRNRNANPEDCMCHGEWPDVARLEKHEAGGETPHESEQG